MVSELRHRGSLLIHLLHLPLQWATSWMTFDRCEFCALRACQWRAQQAFMDIIMTINIIYYLHLASFTNKIDMCAFLFCKMASFLKGEREKDGVRGFFFWKQRRGKWKQASGRDCKQSRSCGWERKYKCENKAIYKQHNTNLSLQVVHSFGLSALSIILCEDFVHWALQVSAYLGRQKNVGSHVI